MKRDFTDEDIIRFLYDEMNQSDSEAFLDTLCTDEQLWERYEYFQEVVEKVSELRFEPSEFTCNKILDVVRETNPNHPSYIEELKDIPTSTSGFFKKWLPISLNLNAVIVMGLILFVSIAVTGTFLKLQRGAIDNPNTGSLVQKSTHEPVELFQWDDSELDTELQDIRQGLENIQDQDESLL